MLFQVGCSDFSGETEKARSLVHIYDTQRGRLFEFNKRTQAFA